MCQPQFTVIHRNLSGPGHFGKKHVVVGNAALSMTPYADVHSAGLAINITF